MPLPALRPLPLPAAGQAAAPQAGQAATVHSGHTAAPHCGHATRPQRPARRMPAGWRRLALSGEDRALHMTCDAGCTGTP